MKQLSLSIACFNPQLYHWSWRIRSSIRSMSDYTEDCSSNSASREDKDYRIIWAHHELVDDRKQQRDSASNARAVIQQRSSLPSKAFVTNSRIHCSSNEECVSASSATLRLQRGFAVHQGTRKVSRKRFVALPFLRESRSRIYLCCFSFCQPGSASSCLIMQFGSRIQQQQSAEMFSTDQLQFQMEIHWTVPAGWFQAATKPLQYPCPSPILQNCTIWWHHRGVQELNQHPKYRNVHQLYWRREEE